MKSLFPVLAFFAITAFGQDHLIAVKKDGKWGYVDASGQTVLQFKFDEAWAFTNGFAVAVEDGQFGLVSANGKWKFPRMAGRTSGDFTFNRLICANEQGKWGAVDKSGKIKVPFEYDVLGGFHGNWAIAGRATTDAELFAIVVIDSLGKPGITFDNIYLHRRAFAEGKRVRDGYLTVLVDGDYANALTVSDIKLSGRPLYYGLLDVKNKRLVNLRIPSLQAEVREGRYNFVQEGIAYSLAIPLNAEPTISDARFSFLAAAIYPFSSAIAAVDKDGKWAFIDKDGSLLSETNLPVSDYTNDMPLYSGGYMTFRKKSGEWIYTDLNGAQRIAMEFEEVEPFQFGGAVVKYKGKYGLIHKDGTWALEPTYEAIRY